MIRSPFFILIRREISYINVFKIRLSDIIQINKLLAVFSYHLTYLNIYVHIIIIGIEVIEIGVLIFNVN